ncbi:DNA-binding domain-containing protein [Nitrosomonas halophila]|uniref:Uncharacterized protein n=1 Tax=Nitrosomonas halophila TaxID=44576 RepID=A0A1H3BKN5_9PROT|nr:putative DNA-binding domain-containing protein [Nitrosomonas halophila]SDX42522.1 hypothetical protein SAMN05421881_100152 [Nitrosomonas halophila]
MQPETLGHAAYQNAFAARIRDPRNAPRPPGATARRMRVYEQLLFNNLESFLLACYPVTRELLSTRAWKRTVRRFFREHRCHSPLFRDIPQAFLDWMEAGIAASDFTALPFLVQLMHYEWLELSVSIAEAEPDPEQIDPDGDLLTERPVLHPGSRLACYAYPVHRIGPRFKPAAPDHHMHCYLLYRDAEDAVHFATLNPVTARLLELIQTEQPTGQAALRQIATEINHPNPQRVIETGGQLLHDLATRGALLGTWKHE